MAPMATARPVIVDVFARDGLQTLLHETQLQPPTTQDKVRLIQELDAAGVPEIEITGFVHPRVIPSLADAEAVADAVLLAPHRAVYRALVPNLRGAERAIAVGVPKLAALIVASETYQRLNANMSVEDNVREILHIKELAERKGVGTMVSMGTSFVCPYTGVVPEERIISLVERFVEAGIDEIGLADSIGLAWPTLVRERTRELRARFPQVRFGLHLHTLAGTALGNAFVGFEEGVAFFEGSVGGIGGGIAMPIHTTDMGNVATEDLVYLFESSGLPTGVDALRVAALGRELQRSMGTGGGRVTGFGTLEKFLEVSRAQLERVAASPPGRSTDRR